jgi:hypothetical protein
MSRQIATGLIAAIVAGLSTTAAYAVNKPVALTVVKTQAEPVACSGNRREYRDFAQCMRVNKFAAKYCSKICR